MAKVLYLCNRRQCEGCSYPECKHTTDIFHAKNFVEHYSKEKGLWYEEVEETVLEEASYDAETPSECADVQSRE